MPRNIVGPVYYAYSVNSERYIRHTASAPVTF
jgi:hypothetical protein